MGLREQIGRRILGKELDKIQESFEVMAQAYRQGPYVKDPGMLMRQLVELDSQYVDLLMRQRGWDIISGQGILGGLRFTEADRKNVIDQSRWAFHFDTQSARAVNGWTDFGFGKKVAIKPQDDALKEIWDEFWNARRNRSLLKQSKLDNLSNKLVIDGELIFIFYISKLDGTVTVRRVNTEDVIGIVYETDLDGNEDTDIPLYYKRSLTTGEVWYPDWAASPEQLDSIEMPHGVERADEMHDQTDVRAQRVSYDDVNGRGWPITYRAITWYDEYKNALHDWSAVASSVAMFPRKVKHKGGSRATDAIQSSLESSFASAGYGLDRNPPPPAGSTWIENQAASLDYFNPMRTGAMEWQQGTLLLAGQMVAGDGMPMVYRGRPDANQNRSVAEVSTIPWDQQMDRYSQTWEDTFQEWVEIIGAAATLYSDQIPKPVFETMAADISVSRPATLTTRTEDLVRALSVVNDVAVAMTAPTDETSEALSALIAVTLERFGVTLEPKEDAPETPDQEPEPGSVEDIAMKALGNYRDGSVSGSQIVEFLMGELVGDR